MNGYCAYCLKALTTGDFNGICQECREMKKRGVLNCEND
jgi:hypothetical protein